MDCENVKKGIACRYRTQKVSKISADMYEFRFENIACIAQICVHESSSHLLEKYIYIRKLPRISKMRPEHTKRETLQFRFHQHLYVCCKFQRRCRRIWVEDIKYLMSFRHIVWSQKPINRRLKESGYHCFAMKII